QVRAKRTDCCLVRGGKPQKLQPVHEPSAVANDGSDAECLSRVWESELKGDDLACLDLRRENSAHPTSSDVSTAPSNFVVAVLAKRRGLERKVRAMPGIATPPGLLFGVSPLLH